MNGKNNNNNLKITVWFNLFIGFYNIYMFNELNSIFHLVLGSLNIGVWVFFRERYITSNVSIKSNETQRKN